MGWNFSEIVIGSFRFVGKDGLASRTVSMSSAPDAMISKLACVLIVEDDALMRQHFEFAVVEHPQLSLLASVGSCKACHEVLLQHRPDIMLVDLGLPDGHGADLIRQMKSMHPSAEAMVVSVFAEEEKVKKRGQIPSW